MNYIVCSVTFIYLCLENVAGFSGENAECIDSSEKNQNFICVSRIKHVHQWYHVYPNGNRQQLIYKGTQQKVKTHFIITLETFDNNTEIYCDSGSNAKVETIRVVWYYRPIQYIKAAVSSIWNSRTDLNQSNNFLIRIGTNETLQDNEDPAVLRYDKTQEVSFDCLEYKDKTNLVIGVINTTTIMIKTYNKTFPDTIFNKSQNGTVLCCMYYEVNETADETWITRHVAKKTVLVYDETVTVPVTDRQDGSADKDMNSSNSTDEVANSPDVDIGNQVAESGKQPADLSQQNANPGMQDANSDNKDASKQATIMYIVSAVAVVFILLVVSVIYLKRCRKKPKVEVNTKVLYADLDFLRRNEPESLPREGPEEESPYAQIVGELRPQ